jgi:hypothetical protein
MAIPTTTANSQIPELFLFVKSFLKGTSVLNHSKV